MQPGVLARACDTVTPQPVAAIVGTVDVGLAELGQRRPDLVVVCVDVRDPGNLGTIIRSAGAAGAGAVVCCAGSVDLFNPKTVRASAGMLFHLPVVAAGDPVEVLDELGRWGLRRWGTAARGGCDYVDADLTAPTALVLGNEAHGLAASLAPSWTGPCASRWPDRRSRSTWPPPPRCSASRPPGSAGPPATGRPDAAGHRPDPPSPYPVPFHSIDNRLPPP